MRVDNGVTLQKIEIMKTFKITVMIQSGSTHLYETFTLLNILTMDVVGNAYRFIDNHNKVSFFPMAISIVSEL